MSWGGHPYSQPQIPRQPGLPFPSPYVSGPQRSSPSPLDLPHSLRPGGVRRPDSHRSSSSRSGSDDYFLRTPNFPQPHVGPQIRHTQSAPAPPLPRKLVYSQPPLPPKPYPHPYASTQFPSNEQSQYAPLPELEPVGPLRESEEDILQRVLAMSAAESEAHQRKTLVLEEEELTRAMQESLSIEPVRIPPVPPLPISVDGVDHIAPIVGSPVDSYFPFTDSKSLPQPQCYDTPAPSIPLFGAHGLSSYPYPSHAGSSRQRVVSQITEDEAFARRLTEEEATRHSQKPPREAGHPPVPNIPLPRYDGGFSSALMPQSAPVPSPAPLNRHLQPPNPNPDVAVAPMLRSTSAQTAIPTQDHEKFRRPGHTELFETASEAVAKPEQADASPMLAAPMRDSSNTPVSVVSSTLSAAESDHSSAVSQTTTAAAVSTQYVDDELLWGVAMGWGVPAVTPAMKPMLGPVPNVVSLPYARSAPFHIRAPSWRHLLKLMARLGNTRLEPSVEAIAEVKTLMQLRVVVSFVKTHETLPDWNTVLYMTIDQAPPGTSPHVLKYRIGDTTTLPYSYTQSTPLMVLREGADASMSKFYTIPSTQKTPYPSLPITFPNLATYLASALDDSRGAHDNTTGMRRLAKFVDMFYPSESGATEAAAFRQGVGQKLMSFVGIGRRQQPRDRNAETFDLVTPFVADDFGR